MIKQLKIVVIAAAAALCAACLPTPAPKPVVPPAATVFCIAPEVHSSLGAPIENAIASIGGVVGITNADGYVYLINVPASASSELLVTADGYGSYSGAYAVDSWSCDLPVTLTAIAPPLPPAATRAQFLAVHDSFNSLDVVISSGSIPWFDAALVSLSPADRLLVYAAKHANGDTHAIIHFSDGRPLYPEPNQPYQNYNTADYLHNSTAFTDMVVEVLQNGFVPYVFLQEDTPAVTTSMLQAAVTALQAHAPNLLPYVMFNPGFDGIFYGWAPADIQTFGQTFRQLDPNGVLTLEFNTGHIPVGNGPADYTPTGMMADFDGLLVEFDLWPMTGDGEWQILGRLLGPAYHRPSDQPATDDPHPPFYLGTDSARGPWGVTCFEWGTYTHTRSDYSRAQMNAAIAYYLGMGCGWAK